MSIFQARHCNLVRVIQKLYMSWGKFVLGQKSYGLKILTRLIELTAYTKKNAPRETLRGTRGGQRFVSFAADK